MFNQEGHDPVVAEWMYRLMHDPEYYEQWFYKDTIEDHIMMINECQKTLE